MRSGLTGGSERKIVYWQTLLLSALAFVLLLSACEGKDGKKAETDQQTSIVSQDEGASGEQRISGPTPESAQGENERSLLALFAEWNGELQCGNIVQKPGGTFAVSIEDQKVTCRIYPNVDRVSKLTLNDLNALSERYITGNWSSEYSERHESRLHQLVIRSHQSGAIEIELHFSGRVGTYELEITDPATGKKRAYRFLLEVPFRYEITRPTEADTAILERGVRDYLLAGETHAYNVTFSHPVDRASVEAMSFGVEGLEAEYDWHSDQSVTVRLKVDDRAVMEDYDHLHFGFGSARAADGLYREPMRDDSIRIQPTRRKTFAFFDPATGKRETYLNTLISYTRLDRSPSGKHVLAEETTVRESMFAYNHVLFDKSGKRIKTLYLDSPMWLKGDDVLLYRKGRSILCYDVETGLEQTVWTASGPVNWVYYDYHAPSGRLVVVTLQENEQRELQGDLYLYERVADPEPRVVRDVFRDLGQYELYPEGVRFIDDDKLFIEYIADPMNHTRERQVMDWNTGELTALAPAENVLPLTRSNLLRHSGGKWEIVSLADGTARPLAAIDPDRHADPYVWYEAVPLSEDWVALLRGGGAADLLHMPTGSIKAVKEHLLSPLPWSGEVAFSIPELKR